MEGYLMARVHFVKKARKDNPAVKKGQSYYWWEFRYGGTHYSVTPPRPSQLTQSEFLSQYLSIQETLEDAMNGASSVSDVEEAIEEAKSELECLRDETDEKWNNMPEQLQYCETGELLQERVETCDEYISNLEAIETPEEPEDGDEENYHPNLELVNKVVGPWPVRVWAVKDQDSSELLSQWFDDAEVAQEALQDELLESKGAGLEDDSVLENLKQEVLDADPGI
jgi:hypothetical protein